MPRVVKHSKAKKPIGPILKMAEDEQERPLLQQVSRDEKVFLVPIMLYIIVGNVWFAAEGLVCLRCVSTPAHICIIHRKMVYYCRYMT